MIAACLAAVLSPLFLRVNPELRSTYQSLGKIVEDRPMQITGTRFGLDTGALREGIDFGRVGFRNWNVSSLSDRRADAHRHALYHVEYGLAWEYDWRFAEAWTLKSDLARCWTVYRGFDSPDGNRTYGWWQIDQSLANPWIVPFYRLRRCVHGSDYLYFKAGLTRSFPLFESFYFAPSVFVEGGNARNTRRVFGSNVNGGGWHGGVTALSLRLECGWKLSEDVTAFAYVEQYETVGHDVRESNSALAYRCAHNDWTHGGLGLRLRF